MQFHQEKVIDSEKDIETKRNTQKHTRSEKTLANTVRDAVSSREGNRLRERH